MADSDTNTTSNTTILYNSSCSDSNELLTPPSSPIAPPSNVLPHEETERTDISFKQLTCLSVYVFVRNNDIFEKIYDFQRSVTNK